MTIERLEVVGYKGFSTKQFITFAVPNSKPGSGITYLTGGNNSGKSSIIEILRARNIYDSPNISIENRNANCDKVEISYVFDDKTETITSIDKETAATDWSHKGDGPIIFIAPSRRAFPAHFDRPPYSSRLEFVKQSPLKPLRPLTHDRFTDRLFEIQADPTYFNELLQEVLGYLPAWSIDLLSSGKYFLKFGKGDHFHSSDGIGEGVINVFVIVDALYDSKPGGIIAIDEPELSLHPSLQKRLLSLIKKFSSNRQIVLATHSPYFVDIDSILNGARLTRVVNEDNGIEIFQSSDATVKSFQKIGARDRFNPHTLGLNARELFFQEDGVIVVEGQDDVEFFPDICSQLNIVLKGHFFGWGAGGAEKFEHVLSILKDLGFKRVVGILDADKQHKIPDLTNKFPDYNFYNICADDIRDKEERLSPGKIGLLNDKRQLKEQFKDETKEMLEKINSHFL